MLYNTILNYSLYINYIKNYIMSFCVVNKIQNRIYVWHFFWNRVNYNLFLLS